MEQKNFLDEIILELIWYVSIILKYLMLKFIISNVFY